MNCDALLATTVLELQMHASRTRQIVFDMAMYYKMENSTFNNIMYYLIGMGMTFYTCNINCGKLHRLSVEG